MRWTRTHSWLLSAILLLAAFGYGLHSVMSAVAPGAGAAYQEAPDVAKPGEMVVISLRLGVWGAGGPANRRYRDVRLLIRPKNDVQWTAFLPSRTSEGADGITSRFEFAAPRDATSISYKFNFTFDDQPKEIAGMKIISIKSVHAESGSEVRHAGAQPLLEAA